MGKIWTGASGFLIMNGIFNKIKITINTTPEDTNVIWNYGGNTFYGHSIFVDPTFIDTLDQYLDSYPKVLKNDIEADYNNCISDPQLLEEYLEALQNSYGSEEIESQVNYLKELASQMKPTLDQEYDYYTSQYEQGLIDLSTYEDKLTTLKYNSYELYDEIQFPISYYRKFILFIYKEWYDLLSQNKGHVTYTVSKQGYFPETKTIEIPQNNLVVSETLERAYTVTLNCTISSQLSDINTLLNGNPYLSIDNAPRSIIISNTEVQVSTGSTVRYGYNYFETYTSDPITITGDTDLNITVQDPMEWTLVDSISQSIKVPRYLVRDSGGVISYFANGGMITIDNGNYTDIQEPSISNQAFQQEVEDGTLIITYSRPFQNNYSTYTIEAYFSSISNVGSPSLLYTETVDTSPSFTVQQNGKTLKSTGIINGKIYIGIGSYACCGYSATPTGSDFREDVFEYNTVNHTFTKIFTQTEIVDTRKAASPIEGILSDGSNVYVRLFEATISSSTWTWYRIVDLNTKVQLSDPTYHTLPYDVNWGMNGSICYFPTPNSAAINYSYRSVKYDFTNPNIFSTELKSYVNRDMTFSEPGRYYIKDNRWYFAIKNGNPRTFSLLDLKYWIKYTSFNYNSPSNSKLMFYLNYDKTYVYAFVRKDSSMSRIYKCPISRIAQLYNIDINSTPITVTLSETLPSPYSEAQATSSAYSVSVKSTKGSEIGSTPGEYIIPSNSDLTIEYYVTKIASSVTGYRNSITVENVQSNFTKPIFQVLIPWVRFGSAMNFVNEDNEGVIREDSSNFYVFNRNARTKNNVINKATGAYSYNTADDINTTKSSLIINNAIYNFEQTLSGTDIVLNLYKMDLDRTNKTLIYTTTIQTGATNISSNSIDTAFLQIQLSSTSYLIRVKPGINSSGWKYFDVIGKINTSNNTFELIKIFDLSSGFPDTVASSSIYYQNSTIYYAIRGETKGSDNLYTNYFYELDSNGSLTPIFTTRNDGSILANSGMSSFELFGRTYHSINDSIYSINFLTGEFTPILQRELFNTSSYSNIRGIYSLSNSVAILYTDAGSVIINSDGEFYPAYYLYNLTTYNVINRNNLSISNDYVYLYIRISTSQSYLYRCTIAQFLEHYKDDLWIVKKQLDPSPFSNNP